MPGMRKMKGLVAAVALSAAVPVSGSDTTVPAAMAGWVKKQPVQSGTKEAICGNYSRTAWIVGSDNGELTVRTVDARSREGLEEVPPPDLPAAARDLAPRRTANVRARHIPD